MHHVIRCLDSAWKHRLPWPSKESGRLFGAQRAYVGCAIARLRAAYGRTRTVALTWQGYCLDLGRYLDAFAPKSCVGASSGI